METQLIKQIVKIGNSAGVVLPKSWLNNKAKITLIEDSIEEISKNAIRILIKNNLLSEAKGIYLIGSYARNEQTNESDIDILVITDNIIKLIKDRKYELTLISEESIKERLSENIMPILPWITEAKTIFNESLIKEYKNTQLTYKNLKWHIETTKSAINMNKSAIDIDKELKQKNTSDSTAYSLILRLRGIYIINCLRKNKLWEKKELIELLKKITGETTAYERYIYVKNNKISKEILPIKQAELLIDYIQRENIKQEEWSKERKN